MKFLKTFLFTISLNFMSFGVVNMIGFCATAPILDTPSFNVIKGNDNQVTQYSLSPEMSVMLIDQAYTDIRDTLYDETGFWIEDIDNAPEINYQNLVTTPNYNNAAWLADKLTNGAKTLAETISENFKFFKQSTPQFGNSVFRYFIGTEFDGTVSNVANSVNYITENGLNLYDSILYNKISNGTINNLTSGDYVKTKNFVFKSGNRIYNINTNNECIFYTFTSGSYYFLYACYPFDLLDSYGYVPISNSIVNFGSNIIYPIQNFLINSSDYFTVNGIKYVYGPVRLRFDNSDYSITSTYPFGKSSNVSDLTNFISNNNFSGSSSLGFDYDLFDNQGNLQQIALLLKQLVGKWVSSDDLGKINTIIREIPIVPIIPDGQQNAVPIAQPTTQNIDDLETLISQIVDDSDKWAEVFPDPSLEPEPEPDPLPNNQGTDVPENFPTTIFNPISDSVGGIFDFVSIFEPLFYIFSFSAGLLGLWLVIPFVILFLILFRMLK